MAKNWSNLHQYALMNQQQINAIRKQVTTGGLRIIISILFLFVGYAIYTNLYNTNVLNLLSYNVLFLFPGLGRFLMNRMVDSNQTDEGVAKSTLGQELADNPDLSGRWGLLEWFLLEKVIALLVAVICFLCLVVLVVSFFV